jgi:hypothetical protein
MQDHWNRLQIETSQLSSKGKRIVAEESGHNMLYSERELITDEILKMIQIKDTKASNLRDLGVDIMQLRTIL